MRHAYLTAFGLLLVAACATPRDQCEAQVDANIIALKQAIAASEANLTRGYGLQEEVTPRLRYGFCTRNNKIETCLRNEYVTKTVPVAIDLEEEQRKLASAKARLSQEVRRGDAALAECSRRYPEGG